jgi:signal transduction histidine kinase
MMATHMNVYAQRNLFRPGTGLFLRINRYPKIEAIAGTDMSTGSITGSAIAKAKAIDGPAVSQRTMLIASNTYGIFPVIPTRSKGEDGWPDAFGIGVIDLGSMIKAALHDANGRLTLSGQDSDLYVFDDMDVEGESDFIYSSCYGAQYDCGTEITREEVINKGVISSIQVLDRTYTLIMVNTADDPNKLRNWLLVVSTMVVSVLLFLLVLIKDKQRQQAEYARAKVAAADRAHQEAKVTSRLLSCVSHDIRTPIQGMLGMQQLLMETTKLDDEQKEYLEILRHCGEVLLGLVDDLMDLLRIGTGKLSLVPANASIQECVESVLKVQQCAANGRGIELLEDIPSRQDLPHVMVDHFRLKQVLLNLIGNALKATPRGGKITVHCEVLSHNHVVKAKDDEETIRIRVSVEDTGCGITEEDAKLIFQPFVQVQNNDDNSSSDDHTSPRATSSSKPSYDFKQGVGLGLSICKDVVTSMGILVRCQSSRSSPYSSSRFGNGHR